MTVIRNAKKLRQYKSRIFFIVVLILSFNSGPDKVGEVKNLSPNFK